MRPQLQPFYISAELEICDKQCVQQTMKSHKQKCSIQEDPVDVSKMKTAAIHLQTLKTELEGIEETEAEVSSIMKHVGALEQILNNAKKLVRMGSLFLLNR
jgi:hypothetical protein